MKIQQIISVREGFMDGFRKARGAAPGPSAAAPRPRAPAPKAAQPAASPFSIISNRDAKFILTAVINGQALDSSQIAKLKAVLRKL